MVQQYRINSPHLTTISLPLLALPTEEMLGLLGVDVTIRLAQPRISLQGFETLRSNLLGLRSLLNKCVVPGAH